MAAVTCKHCFRTPSGAGGGRPPCEAFEKGQFSPHLLLTKLDLAETLQSVWHPWYLPVTMKMLHTHALSSRDALWWDFKIPLFFRVSPENAIFPRCSTRGRLNYADLHVPQHATVVSVGCTHACHAAAFSLLIYDMEVRMGFSFSSIPSAHERMAFPKIRSLPSEPKGVGCTDLPKFKLLAMTGKRGSWVGFLSLLSFSGRDIGGRFELWGILLKYRERGS